MRKSSTLLALAVVLPVTTFCTPDQTREHRAVTGIVGAASTGEPIRQAVVTVDGTLLQAVTDERGAFSLSAPQEEFTAIVRALGYQELEVSLPPSRDSLNATLEISQDPSAAVFAATTQFVDSNVTVHVLDPAYAKGTGPVVLIDEGHHNFHTAAGRYLVFANVLREDGYVVRRSQTAFTPDGLAGADVLVIASALHGLEDGRLPAKSAFKPEEIVAVREWVEEGGALFLDADHMPVSGAAADLTTAFGVRSMNGFVYESVDGQLQRSPMMFRRSDGSLRAHSILEGRSPTERIDSVATFTGQALQFGEEFTPLLVFRDNVVSLNTEVWWEFDGVPHVNVGGWSQGAVGQIGRGRVAVFGEAAMFTSQIRGPDRRPDGMSQPEASQNQQFLLNVMHWLTGVGR